MNSIGDQARAFALQIASNRLKTTLATLTQEVASGQVADLGQRLDGNTRALGEIESRIGLVGQFQQNGSEAAIRLTAVQNIFQGTRATTSALGVALASDPFSSGGLSIGVRGVEVANAFDAVVRQFNSTNSNRFVLSGDASDQQPLASAAQMLDDLDAVTAGMTTAQDVATAVAAWFDAPEGGGGYLDRAYFGSQGPAQRIAVGDGVGVTMDTTGASAAVRDLLKGLATAAMADRGAMVGNPAEQRSLLVQGGQRMVTADTALLGEMGRVGLAQQVVERAAVTNGASLSTLERARGDIRSADPFQTAAALTEVESQLESLYAVTARLSKLKLVDYLR